MTGKKLNYIKFVTFSFTTMVYLLMYLNNQLINMTYLICMIFLANIIYIHENFDLFGPMGRMKFTNVILSIMGISSMVIANINLFNLYSADAWVVIISIILTALITGLTVINMIIYTNYYKSLDDSYIIIQ